MAATNINAASTTDILNNELGVDACHTFCAKGSAPLEQSEVYSIMDSTNPWHVQCTSHFQSGLKRILSVRHHRHRASGVCRFITFYAVHLNARSTADDKTQSSEVIWVYTYIACALQEKSLSFISLFFIVNLNLIFNTVRVRPHLLLLPPPA